MTSRSLVASLEKLFWEADRSVSLQKLPQPLRSECYLVPERIFLRSDLGFVLALTPFHHSALTRATPIQETIRHIDYSPINLLSVPPIVDLHTMNQSLPLNSSHRFLSTKLSTLPRHPQTSLKARLADYFMQAPKRPSSSLPGIYCSIPFPVFFIYSDLPTHPSWNIQSPINPSYSSS